MGEAAHGQDREDRVRPGRREPRRAAPGQDREPREGDGGEEAREKPWCQGVDAEGQLVQGRDVDGHNSLERIEHDAVGEEDHPRDQPEPVQAREADPGRHALERDRGAHGADEPERDLLHDRRRPAKAPQRVEVEEHEDERQRHRDLLGEERGGEGQEREAEPPSPTWTLRFGGLQVREHGEEEEEARDHVPPLGDPGHALSAERMDSEGERRRQRSGRERRRGTGGGREPEQPPGHRVAERDVEGVEQHVGRVIAARMPPPGRVVD